VSEEDPEQPRKRLTRRRPRRARGNCSEADWELQRLTLAPADELGNPADVADVIASLSVATSLMSALLSQLAAFLEIEHAKVAVSHRHGSSAAEPPPSRLGSGAGGTTGSAGRTESTAARR
jgi:hypothetical protein